MSLHGQGVETNLVEAVKWYRKAAEQNHAESQANLAWCYLNGEGVAQNPVEAYAWSSLAAGVFGNAAKIRDSAAYRMTPEQIYAGSKRTRELRAQIEARLESAGKAQSTRP